VYSAAALIVRDFKAGTPKHFAVPRHRYRHTNFEVLQGSQAVLGANVLRRRFDAYMIIDAVDV
jgi:hypothetical protein